MFRTFYKKKSSKFLTIFNDKIYKDKIIINLKLINLFTLNNR